MTVKVEKDLEAAEPEVSVKEWWNLRENAELEKADFSVCKNQMNSTLKGRKFAFTRESIICNATFLQSMQPPESENVEITAS